MQSGRNVTIVSYRATTHEVNETDVDALTSKLDKLQNVASAALTAADLRHPVNGHDVLLDDASAIAILLALKGTGLWERSRATVAAAPEAS